MQFTRVPSDTWQKLQMNAGIICKSFNPATAAVTDLLGATTGGFRFASNPTYQDFGADVDNVPPNTFQLKKLLYYDPAISGTFLTVDAATAKMLVGGATVATNKITPATDLTADDFDDVWVVGDYSDKNTGATAGFLAIHLMNALNVTGFQAQTTKDGKGQFSFEMHGHYDLTSITTVPFDIYVQAGTTPTP